MKSELWIRFYFGMCCISVLSADRLRGCLYRTELCSQLDHYCYDDGRSGLCKSSLNNFPQYLDTNFRNEIKKSVLTPRKATNRNYVHQYSETPVLSVVQGVQYYLKQHGYRLSDLSEGQFNDLATAIVHLVLKKEEYDVTHRNILPILIKQTKLLLAEHGLTFAQLSNSQIDALAAVLARICIKHKDRCYFPMLYVNETESKTGVYRSAPTSKIVAENPKVETKKPHFTSHVQPIITSHDNVPIVVTPARNEEMNDENLQVMNVETPEKRNNVQKNNKDQATKAVEPLSDTAPVVSNPWKSNVIAPKIHKHKSIDSPVYMIVIICVCAVVVLLLVICILIYCFKAKENELKLARDSTSSDPLLDEDYQELCRQHYASKSAEQGDHKPDKSACASLASQSVQSPIFSPKIQKSHINERASSRSSLCSWSEEPITTTLDVSTGHAVLSYMEDHLFNKDRLNKEWEELCKYQVDNVSTDAAQKNPLKNRYSTILPYDHNRVKLKVEENSMENDYINASYIVDNDPRLPVYIATQGPLSSTIHQFWQMIWEQGCAVIVMLTPVAEEGVSQCARYWPDEGSSNYAKFEIHLVSEHIWCEDYLVRSLYLKNVETGETRTLTQFHFLSWPMNGIPFSPKPLLELRRKVSKCYKGNNSPIVVHCNDGSSRTGTYILIDLVITRMVKGAKEIDVAATLEYLRDQRVGMVASKKQMEFALSSVAEEVNGILKSLLH